MARATGPVRAGFWFEPIEYQTPRVGGALTAADMAVITSLARAELQQAFAGFSIAFTDDRASRYAVRVVERVGDLRTGRSLLAGQTRAIAGFGGNGELNFSLLAGQAVRFAPESASRESIIEAIGRGVGRSAVHEFAHVFLGAANIDDRSDPLTYEFASAARREQYYGDLRWGRALPLLERRFTR
jgi:hypothetical protein